MLKEVKRKKKKDRIAVTLMLCFCVIALTSIFTIKANIEKLSNNAKEVTVSKEKPTTESPNVSQEKEDNNDDLQEKSKEVSAKSSIVDSQNKVQNKINYICPIIGGKVCKDYSMDMIVYSLTLDQFMTHPGCDIVSDTSSNVVAASAGRISRVYEDDKYGVSIEITHPNGIISKYCNLSKKLLVEEGDTVAQGQTLGTTGKSALYESAEEPHLHLEFIKEGKVQNPASYISFQ